MTAPKPKPATSGPPPAPPPSPASAPEDRPQPETRDVVLAGMTFTVPVPPVDPRRVALAHQLEQPGRRQPLLEAVESAATLIEFAQEARTGGEAQERHLAFIQGLVDVVLAAEPLLA